MLSLTDLDPDQTAAIDYCFENDATFLIAGMGAGKSVIALTAAEELLAQHQIKRVLVMAPLKVCNKVWSAEHLKWEHLKHLNVGIMTEDNRESFDDEKIQRYDICVVNFDALQWFKDNALFTHFDGLIVDEATKLKAGGAWFKAIRREIPLFKWRLVMTGTPVSENWVQLFYQQFLVDAGATFGGNKQKWLDKYFYPTDYKRYNWAVKPGQEPRLAALITPYVHTVPDYRDSLPPLHVGTVDTPLPPSARKAYKEMAGQLKTHGVTAQNAAVKVGKLMQITNGFLYQEDKTVTRLHDAKLDALKEILGKTSNHFLIAVNFIEELAQLREALPDMACLADGDHVIDQWNAGEMRMLAMHPKSGAHGLNMAAGGHDIIWLSPPWSRDQFDQFNARLWWRGQTHAVDVQILVAPDSVDELIMARLDDKAAFMPAFLAHLAKSTS